MFKKITDSVQGRTTFFLALFFVTGLVLQIFGKLDGNFILFFTAFMAAVIGHSIKEDLNLGGSTPDTPAK